jgi:hypothetical protein
MSLAAALSGLSFLQVTLTSRTYHKPAPVPASLAPGRRPGGSPFFPTRRTLVGLTSALVVR